MTHLRFSTRRLLVVAAGVTALTTAIGVMPAAADDNGSGLKPVIEGLDGPRGLSTFHDGRILFSQGDGSVSVAERDDGQWETRELGAVPAGFIAPAVAFGPHGRVWVLTPGGEPGSGSNTLYYLKRGEDPTAFADIGAYQVTDPDPFNLADPPEESNPFGLATLPDRSVLVADAAANDLLRVFPNGDIVTVARLKPRTVEVPEELPDTTPDGEPLPPAGAEIPSEGVATSVTV
ncbi:MAG: ScyD/ScyE family protein, partial [Actinomycetes bacterium]